MLQLDRRTGVVSDVNGVVKRFGVRPESIPDWLALVGDSSDGFPGLKGWGAKSAAAVLLRYGHLEDIPHDHWRWDVDVRGATKLAATLNEQRELAWLFRDLATLRTEPAPFAARRRAALDGTDAGVRCGRRASRPTTAREARPSDRRPIDARLTVMRRLALLSVAALVAVTGLATQAGAAPGSTLGRGLDPVVLTGADVPSLQNIAPNLLVAFRYSNGVWVQVPVQVDERKQVDLGLVYNQQANNVKPLSYADANTFAGPDVNPNVDPNDEIVFMAKDAGGPAPQFVQPGGRGQRLRRAGARHRPAHPRRGGLRLPLPADGRAQPGRREELRDLQLQPALGELQGHLQAAGRSEPRGLARQHGRSTPTTSVTAG